MTKKEYKKLRESSEYKWKTQYLSPRSKIRVGQYVYIKRGRYSGKMGMISSYKGLGFFEIGVVESHILTRKPYIRDLVTLNLYFGEFSIDGGADYV